MPDADDQPLPLMDGPPDARVRIDGVRYLYFGGTSYLGLHARAEPTDAGCTAMRHHGLHTATTRGGFGNSEPLLALEREAAGYFAKEAALCLPSGYLTATALLKTVAADYDTLLIAAGSHYAVADAAAVARLPQQEFDDAASLAATLDRLPAHARPLLLTDGLFPLGRLAPLAEYVRQLERFDRAGIVIDDAHGVGVLGEQGRGMVEHAGLQGRANRSQYDEAGVAVYVGATLSKALGGYGGVIAGDARFIDRIRRVSQVYVGASALPTPVAAASQAALRIAREEGVALRNRLRRNVNHLRTGLAAMALEVDTASPAPVVALALDSARRMEQIHAGLRERNILVPYIRHYSGVGPAGVLRIATFASHTTAMIDPLLDACRELI